MSLRSILVFAIVVAIVLWLIGAVLIYLTPFDASAGQLIVDILLLPTVAFGFYLGILELRKQRESPDIDVEWPESNVIKLKQTRRADMITRLVPTIINRGNTATTWFTIQLEVPKTLVITSRNLALHKIVGDDDNWKPFESPTTYNFTFMSNGQFIMYPGYRMFFCYIDFRLLPDKVYPYECEITYSIVTDKTKATRGSFIVKIEPEHLLEDMLLKSAFPSQSKRTKDTRLR